MDKLARSDWKRHSAPYDISNELTLCGSHLNDVEDQAMQAFTEDGTQRNNTGTIGRVRKRSVNVLLPETSELSTDQFTPGVLKIYGETILPGVQYKSVLASCRSTVQELVKQAIERFGLPVTDCKKFVLCDVVGNYERSNDVQPNGLINHTWQRTFVRILSDRDKPLLLQKFWKPIDGYSRRYELHERSRVTDLTDDDDTSGLNHNARKILISKLRPGAIPLFDVTSWERDTNRLNLELNKMLESKPIMGITETSVSKVEYKRVCSSECDTAIPTKHPFFVNVRGFDVQKDKTIYVIKSKRFTFGNPNINSSKDTKSDVPKIGLYAPDIESVHCNVKVYRFKKSNGVSDPVQDRYNYFLELDPQAENICLNGYRIQGKALMKSGDIVNIGIYYVLLFKDCSRGNDVPLSLSWLPAMGISEGPEVDSESSNLQLDLGENEVESNSATDESADTSIPERMSFAYLKDKEDELVKYICAIIQQQNTCQSYPLTVAFLFSMCIEHASRKFERRQLKHLFLRILFTVRENVAETAKSLSACKFSCTLVDNSQASPDRDRKLERLLLWISNCVQLLLFLKHTFHLPEVTLSDRGRDDRKSRKEDNVKHAHGQLVTGLEEIIMFCFQQCVYTITKALHPTLHGLLDSNPFSDANSDQCSMEDVIRMFGRLAEVTHSVMLHEGITRQLFTYLFFFANTNVFNKVIADDSGVTYFNWQSGVRIRANLSQLEDWATQNGLEDEFSQMFERLLAVSELLATSKNTLVKYEWPLMKTHYQPLTHGQLHYILTHYNLGGKPAPSTWTPSPEELESILREGREPLSLSSHPPFALPDNCGLVDLIRCPEDTSFWNQLRRLKSLYGGTVDGELSDDSDSGFSIGHTPRGSAGAPKGEMADPFYEQENEENVPEETRKERRHSLPESSLMALMKKRKSSIPVKKCKTNPWIVKVPKAGTGVCNCANVLSDERESEDTLASDLMKEEHRERIETADSQRKTERNKGISPLLRKAYGNNVSGSYKPSLCKSETKCNVPAYQKLSSFANVANCSARTLPKSLQIRERNKLKQLQNKLSQGHSFSIEDLPMRLLRHRPSASFEEAIERGYTSDTYAAKSDSQSEPEEVKSQSLNSKSPLEQKPTPKPRLPRNGIKRHKSLVTDSASSDDVFLDETAIDSLYKCYLSDIPASLLPKMSTFRPISTSSNSTLKLRSQKLSSVSFESSSKRSSVELAEDDLFVNNVDQVYDKESQVKTFSVSGVIVEPEARDFYPGDVFTEVNENTLASRKRHGSSLNVAPSAENSPRTSAYEEVSEILGPDENRVSPCPMFTVNLQKREGGLGLALIDGLHTTLRLAGIYIRKIVPDSPAAENGSLQVGDRILAVEGKSVIGASYQSTMKALKEAGDKVTLLVARGNESMATKVSVSQV